MRHPLLFQINTRVVLYERGRQLSRPATLDDLPDAWFEQIAAQGFRWVWLLGVWQLGELARQVSRSNASLLAAYRRTLPDLQEADIAGSPFAIERYTVDERLGGDAALARTRKRLAARGLGLVLDYVVNHMAPDHPWVGQQPEFFVHGSEEDLAREPQNYTRLPTSRGPMIFAYGRDPYFDGWPDTVQLNHLHPACREAMIGELVKIAGRCDGVRCDMAMLVLPDVFAQTWGERARPKDAPPVEGSFWPRAIQAARARHPDFLFIAEAYWDREWALQQEGFDFTYDKRLYDRLRAGVARPVREHLMAVPAYQGRSVRFLENHDEPRAAATFPFDVHRAAAVITYFVPGMRFFHEGQLEGRRAHVSMHLTRRPVEELDRALSEFYERLLACLRRPEVHDGSWRLHVCRPAWAGNGSWDQFIVCSWERQDARLLVVVNYAPSRGQCYVPLEVPVLDGRRVMLVDRLGDARYERSGDELNAAGLYLDLPPWGYHVFELMS